MKLFALFLLLPAVAPCVTVETLPQSEFADTEVSTNIPFAVSFDAMSRVNFSLSLEASPSNGVEVSIGEDANGDGNLSVEEAAYTFGFDCGRWFKRDVAKDEETDLPAPRGEDAPPVAGPSGAFGGGYAGTVVERTFVLKRRMLDERWDMVKVTRRGGTAIGEVALVEGKKPGKAVIVR